MLGKIASRECVLLRTAHCIAIANCGIAYCSFHRKSSEFER